MALTYYQIRFLHFKGTLAAWLKGLDKAAFAVTATIGPTLFLTLLFLLVAAADGLSNLVDPNTGTMKRAFIISAWQIGSLVLLRSFREAVFMPPARLFFDSLPILYIEKLTTDAAISIQCYSVLWFPFAWACVVAVSRGQGVDGVLSLLSIVEFVALGLCINLLLLRNQPRESLIAIFGLAVFVFAYPFPWMRLLTSSGALALGGACLWKAYKTPREAATGYLIKGAFADRLAIGSGLLIPFLLNELRVTLLMRIAIIGGSLSLCAMLLSVGESTGSAIGAFVLVAAIATIALYGLPELCRSTVMSQMNFIAGQPHFRRRLAIAVNSVPTLLFVVSLLGAYYLANRFTAPALQFPLQAALPAKVFSIAYVLGAIASRLGIQSVTWIMPLTNVVAAIVLSGLI